MTIRGVLVAGIYSVSIAVGGLAGGSAGPAGASLVASAEAPAPQSETAGQRAAALPVRSTHIERRDAAAGLGPAMAAIAQHDAGPVWLAWTVPAVRHQRHGSDERNRDWHRENTGCVLDDDGHFQNGSSTNDDTTTLVVLARVSGGVVDRVTFTDARCTVEAGTRTVYWMDGVRHDDSVAVLTKVVRREGADLQNAPASRHTPDQTKSAALAAIALTDDPSADRVLEELVAPASPASLRRDAAFWMGAARGAAGARVIDRPVAHRQGRVVQGAPHVRAHADGRHRPRAPDRYGTARRLPARQEPGTLLGGAEGRRARRRHARACRRRRSGRGGAEARGVRHQPAPQGRRRAEADCARRHAPRRRGTQAGDVLAWARPAIPAR